MYGWRREGCRITASPDLNTPFPAGANPFATSGEESSEQTTMRGSK